MADINLYPTPPASWRQLILLDDEACILASCDSIFCTKKLRETGILEFFPLVESIFPNIVELKPGHPEIRIHKISPVYRGLSGYYDFSFIRTDIDTRLPILWTIYDFTRLYEDYYKNLQQKHDIEMARELLEMKF